MLKLKKYSFYGIGRFVEKQTVDFESKNHLIQIDGINTSTGGSSGAGKSTTVEALAYLLGISEIPATQLQSRVSDEPIYVEAEFEEGIKISRSKKDGLIIETSDGTVSGNSKLAEEKLDEIVGVSRDLLKTMCYKRQKQGGFLLNLTPKQSYDFLMQCLDLKEFQSKIAKLEDMLKNKYKPRKIELEASTKAIQESVLQLNSLLKEKTKPEAPREQSVSIKNDIKELQTKMAILEDEHTKEIRALGSAPQILEKPVFEKEEDLRLVNDDISKIKAAMHERLGIRDLEIEQASSAINKINNKINESNQLKKLAIQIDSKIQELCKQYQHLEAGNCPTCLRVWQVEENQQKIQQIEEQIESNKKIFESYMSEVEKIPHYKMMKKKAEELLEIKKKTQVNVLEERDLEECLEKQRILLNQKQNLHSIITQKYLEESNKWNQKQSEIDNLFNSQKTTLNRALLTLQHQIKMIETEKLNYQKNLLSYEKDCNNIKDKINLNTTELKKQTEELNTIEKNILLSEESIRLIKNFTLQKFQDTLNYIGNRATEIINMIPNMSNAVIFFENSKETKTGNIKNEINAIINLEGDVGIPIKTLSGGERTSADFAIDLAVSEMIENMTQKGVNFLIIDEGFDGLDSISKIQCLEILKNFNTDKKILIIDHSSEVKEMLYDTILVKRIGEKSFIYE